MRSRACQEDVAKDCPEIEELQRGCCAKTDRVKIDELSRVDGLSVYQGENISTVKHLLAQIRDLQDKVNSWNDTRECFDPETASSFGVNHVPSQPLCMPLDTRNTTGTSRIVFEGLLARGEPSPALFENSMNLASAQRLAD